MVRNVLRAIDETREERMSMNMFTQIDRANAIAAAVESDARFQRGTPLSILDGIPVCVKEEVDVKGLASTLGTSFLQTPAGADASCVARLRAAGAIIVCTLLFLLLEDFLMVSCRQNQHAGDRHGCDGY